MTTFKELLDQCSWEDLEDFRYEFPDVGMDEGRWKMEGFRRMYDELCTQRRVNTIQKSNRILRS